MNSDRNEIKRSAANLGAELCGIAAADSFIEAPPGHHPRDLLSECRSVIVLARQFPPESMKGGPERYTRARDRMTALLNGSAAALAKELSGRGAATYVQQSQGTGSWKSDGRYRDTLSLKHAAVLAGLGKIGRNTLVINEKFGNMIWLGAVLTSLDLQPDPPAEYEACIPGCTICLEACPVSALGDELMSQGACFAHAYSCPAGKEMITCWKCREACPRHQGLAQIRR